MISVVMGYYNRLELLTTTLESIAKTTVHDYEVIVVDDFSDASHSLDHLPGVFEKVKIIKMADLMPEKIYFNPCFAYNVGFSYSIGDKIIIQNPECYHQGDIISHVNNNVTDDNYLSFHCYASTVDDLQKLKQHREIDLQNEPLLSLIHI